jgi:hypothetical protein
MQAPAFDSSFVHTCRANGLSVLETAALLSKQAGSHFVKQARRQHHINLASRHIKRFLPSNADH